MGYDTSPAGGPPAANSKFSKNIGEPLPKEQWQVVRDLAATDGKKNGKVELAEPNKEYVGGMEGVSGDHALQRVGQNTIIAHDMRTWNRQDRKDVAMLLADKDFVADKSRELVVKYGEREGAAHIRPRERGDDAPAQTGDKPEVKHLGKGIPKAEWENAVKKVSSPGTRDGKVVLPKAESEYAGKVLFMSDTHLVQQVGRNAAIVHDLTLLTNAKELIEQYDAGKIAPSTNVVIRYGKDRGEAEVIPFSVTLANEVKAKAAVWAEGAISNDKTRGIFLKHVDNFTTELAKGIKLQAAKAPAAPLRQHDRALQQERAR
jgi:hypothetical protein